VGTGYAEQNALFRTSEAIRSVANKLTKKEKGKNPFVLTSLDK